MASLNYLKDDLGRIVGIQWREPLPQRAENWGEYPKTREEGDPQGTGLKLTAAQIEAEKSERGGWTKATLAKWGVPWPPPHGWRKKLLRGMPVT